MKRVGVLGKDFVGPWTLVHNNPSEPRENSSVNPLFFVVSTVLFVVNIVACCCCWRAGTKEQRTFDFGSQIWTSTARYVSNSLCGQALRTNSRIFANIPLVLQQAREEPSSMSEMTRTSMSSTPNTLEHPPYAYGTESWMDIR